MIAVDAAVIAANMLADKHEWRRLARIIRANDPKVQISLRVSGESAEILDLAAANRGLTIDAFFERIIREAAR